MALQLERFVDAQQSLYAQALAELRDGRKRSHWMWFVFPQIAGLGRSEMALFYAIADLDEARAYCAHPLLGPRLREATEAVLGHAGRTTAETISGGIDAVKLRSSMTLFEAAAASEARFAEVLDNFYGGLRDPETLQRLAPS